jgi:hypothetical protein
MNVGNLRINYLTTLKEHVKLFWRSGTGKKLPDSSFVRCYLELFLTESSYECPREDEVGGIYIQRPSIRWGQLRFFFAKKEWPDKARNTLYNFSLLSFEPGPNPARTRTLSVPPGRSPTLGDGVGQAREGGLGPRRCPLHCPTWKSFSPYVDIFVTAPLLVCVSRRIASLSYQKQAGIPRVSSWELHTRLCIYNLLQRTSTPIAWWKFLLKFSTKIIHFNLPGAVNCANLFKGKCSFKT